MNNINKTTLEVLEKIADRYLDAIDDVSDLSDSYTLIKREHALKLFKQQADIETTLDDKASDITLQGIDTLESSTSKHWILADDGNLTPIYDAQDLIEFCKESL